MRGLSAEEILRAWETGRGLRPAWQAMQLLATDASGFTREQAAELTVGARDRALLELRERTLGARIAGFAECPVCGQRLEFDLDWRELAVPAGPAHSEATPEIEAGGIRVRFRQPVVRDLLAISDSAGPGGALEKLLSRIVIEASRNGEPLPAAELQPEAREAVAARLAAIDPAAEVLLDLTCPACGRADTIAFDTPSFFWCELASVARRLLREVHTLACAYGWSEGEILAMTSARRQAYLELVEA